MNLIASRHGTSESQRAILFDYLYAQKFPAPGRFVEFPLDSKVVKLQRMFDYRLEDIDLRVLFDHLNETTVLHILATVLLERKLIFISQNLKLVSPLIIYADLISCTFIGTWLEQHNPRWRSQSFEPSLLLLFQKLLPNALAKVDQVGWAPGRCHFEFSTEVLDLFYGGLLQAKP